MKIKGRQLRDVAKPGMLLVLDDDESWYDYVMILQQLDLLYRDVCCCRFKLYNLHTLQIDDSVGIYPDEDLKILSDEL